MSDHRDQQLHFRVSKPELERIRNKMEASGILSIGSYLRKMALDGYCLHLESAAAAPHGISFAFERHKWLKCSLAKWLKYWLSHGGDSEWLQHV